MRPLGVAATIMPWNSNDGAIGVKLAAGCPMVVKRSEWSASNCGLKACHDVILQRP